MSAKKASKIVRARERKKEKKERERERKINWLIDSLSFEYGNFISYKTFLPESRIETEVNTVKLH